MTDPFFARTLDMVTGQAAGYARPAVQGAGLDLSVGEAWFPLPDDVQVVVQEAVAGLDRIWYGDPAGEPGLRAAYAARLPTTAGRVLVCAGGKEAAWLAVRYLIQRHEVRVVLVPRPGWQPYAMWAAAAGCYVIGYDPAVLAADPATLAELLPTDVTGRSPLLVLNYPHNPTGIAVDQDGMDALIAVAREHRLPVVSDEVYRTFTPGDVSAVRAPGYDPGRHVVVDSTSKWLTTAGLRVGFLVADPAVVRDLTAFRATYASCTSVLGQRVAEALIISPATTRWLDDVRAHIDTLRTTTADALAGYGVPVVSHGGLYLWIRRTTPTASTASAPAVCAPVGGVAARVNDGAGFGATGMVRVCIARASLDPVQAAAAVVTALEGAG